jgi:hypothetical protein
MQKGMSSFPSGFPANQIDCASFEGFPDVTGATFGRYDRSIRTIILKEKKLNVEQVPLAHHKEEKNMDRG